MKDNNVSTLNQDEFLKAKRTLDDLIAGVASLASLTEKRMLECCKAEALDQRDDLAEMAGYFRQAQGLLMHARAVGGRLEGGGITRSGGT